MFIKRFFIFFFLLGFTASALVAAPANKSVNNHRAKVNQLNREWGKLKKELRGRQSERIAANKILAKNGWVPIPKKSDLAKMIAAGRLVPLPTNEYLNIDESQIPAHRRVTTPGYARYILGFSESLQVHLLYSSGARSAEDQTGIAAGNGNAAPTTGKKVSAHLYPPAIDWAYKDMPIADRVKFAVFLKGEKAKGNVQVAIETNQSCFHVVYLKEKAAGPPVFSATPPAKKRANQKGGQK